MEYSSIGDKIKRLRKDNNLTQEVLAEQLDISYTYLSQIERGVRGISIDILILFANRFNVSVDYLLSDYLNKDIGKESKEIDDELLKILEDKTPTEKLKFVNIIKAINEYI
jgi:transcriptional regulator with XRE-family HTH domain